MSGAESPSSLDGVEIVLVDDAEEAAAHAASLLAEAARAGATIALSGGSTPRRAYVLAAGLEPDWSGADVWLGDERCVPAEDERANARLLRETLLAGVERAPRVHLVPTELSPDEAALAYDRALAGVHLDVALQGLGGDGHTASLFPGAPSLEVTERRAVAADAGLEPWVPRVTMTLPFLASAAHVVFLAVGADKAEPARRAFVDPPSPETPASLLRSRSGRTTAILDRAAAARLA
ncbi:MAG: 6-phosphogluconolactonase [Actinobacteria bacterium]|nr:6-phosphogluconolactonase [Actinomycetota bacterium]